jgi:hypothetical protein
MSSFSYLLLLKPECGCSESAHRDRDADNRGPSRRGTVPDLAGDGDSPPSPSPIWRRRGRSPVPDSHRGVRALRLVVASSPLSRNLMSPS